MRAASSLCGDARNYHKSKQYNMQSLIVIVIVIVIINIRSRIVFTIATTSSRGCICHVATGTWVCGGQKSPFNRLVAGFCQHVAWAKQRVAAPKRNDTPVHKGQVCLHAVVQNLKTRLTLHHPDHHTRQRHFMRCSQHQRLATYACNSEPVTLMSGSNSRDIASCEAMLDWLFEMPHHRSTNVHSAVHAFLHSMKSTCQLPDTYTHQAT